MKYDEIPLINNVAIHNFEMLINNHRAFIDYKQKADKMFLIHTEVPAELEGQGVASAMVEKTLHYIEDHQLKLVPLCQYVQVFLNRRPEWNRLVEN